jgi:hypothetical protein
MRVMRGVSSCATNTHKKRRGSGRNRNAGCIDQTARGGKHDRDLASMCPPTEAALRQNPLSESESVLSTLTLMA